MSVRKLQKMTIGYDTFFNSPLAQDDAKPMTNAMISLMDKYRVAKVRFEIQSDNGAEIMTQDYDGNNLEDKIFDNFYRGLLSVAKQYRLKSFCAELPGEFVNAAKENNNGHFRPRVVDAEPAPFPVMSEAMN